MSFYKETVEVLEYGNVNDISESDRIKIKNIFIKAKNRIKNKVRYERLKNDPVKYNKVLEYQREYYRKSLNKAEKYSRVYQSLKSDPERYARKLEYNKQWLINYRANIKTDPVKYRKYLDRIHRAKKRWIEKMSSDEKAKFLEKLASYKKNWKANLTSEQRERIKENKAKYYRLYKDRMTANEYENHLKRERKQRRIHRLKKKAEKERLEKEMEIQNTEEILQAFLPDKKKHLF